MLPPLLTAGVRDFFVAHWSEVAAVRAHSADAGIAVLHGVANAKEVAFARATGAKPVINSLQQARTWLTGEGGPCHLMVDTGINRLGLDMSDLGDPVVGRLQVDTLMSHLSSADEDSDRNLQQLTLFQQASAVISARHLSLANSAGIALGPDYHFDLTRPGLAIYGGIPRPELATHIQQVVSMEAAVLQVRQLSAGDFVGYNATWQAKAPTRAATISLGYADGILRNWGANGALQHAGQTLPIIGRVSMDMVIVDCTHSTLREGDFCSLSYTLPQASEITGLSQYELLTVLGQRFDRVPGQH